MSRNKTHSNLSPIPPHIADESKSFQDMIRKYYGYLYSNFERPEIQARIVNIEIILQLIQDESRRSFYKIYIRPKSWLPQTLIKNPASFFVLCTIHWFLPNIESIMVQDSWKKINLLEYQHLIAVSRMIQLFFVKGFDFVLYDVINKILQNPEIKKLFESSWLSQLNHAEILAISKVLEDIKKVWFDIHKHHFHEELGKLFNTWTFSENMFLEVAIKFENNVREHIWFESTYIKPASYVEDSQYKTDLNFIYCIKSIENKYNDIPIQFTTSLDSWNNKLNSILQFFRNSNLKEFVYIKINWKFRENIDNKIESYKERIEDSKQRELYDITTFPLFINHYPENIDELIVAYTFLHHVIKRIENKKWNFIPNLKCVIWNVDFSDIKLKTTKMNYRWNWLWWFKYEIFRWKEKMCDIFYINKIPKIPAKNKQKPKKRWKA